MSNQDNVKTNERQHSTNQRVGIDSNVKIDSQKDPEILVETNLNTKLRQALAKKLGEELILLSGFPRLPKKDLTSSDL